MGELIPLVILILAFIVGVSLIPFGLPGLWLMVVALVGYAALGRFEQVGWQTLAAVVVLGAVAEAAEAWLGFRFAKKYGGSNRAGWGALLGGLVGAVIGMPVPVIGNIVGAFVGAFVGAIVLQHSPGTEIKATLGAGWGAVLGRASGAAIKIAIAFAIAVIGLYAAWG
ncbi:MAG: DUF456 family protein [Gemmatimonadetes bacterium]|nr:DUF456 family protein [Gemmatimonadota bacterium]NIO33085.1 DUF456 family protein [Gemmatimonadota bacterium]